jgi:hypothetical protein
MRKTFWIILAVALVLSGAGYFANKLKLNGVSKAIKGYEPVILDLWLDEVQSTTGNLFKNGDYTNLIIRNRPHGKLQIVSSLCVPLSSDRFYLRRVSVPTVQSNAEPFQEPFLWQCRLTVRDPHSLSTENGFLSQGNQLKVSTRIALEGPLYRVDGFIVNVTPENPKAEPAKNSK